MASRFPNKRHPHHNQSSLFGPYADTSPRSSPHGKPGAAGYGGYSGYASGIGADGFSASSAAGYPTAGQNGYGYSGLRAGFQRDATPGSNSRVQYTESVLSGLEEGGQSEEVEGIFKKVGMLKELAQDMSREIQDSSNLISTLNDTFDTTRVRLRGTMNRMLRMAERSGVGWRVWLGFFAVVFLLFVYVWLF
ncbi:hypothetical protein VTN49DRAFT_8011 [Thermomyces lanuginosus]|uniref:uncharacterized protein n=1 Tax=Thermomyces lanuginosus TaxID=5541 RepID=UPI0037429599